MEIKTVVINKIEINENDLKNICEVYHICNDLLKFLDCNDIIMVGNKDIPYNINDINRNDLITTIRVLNSIKHGGNLIIKKNKKGD